ncbi:MAG: S8 family serine peptidase [Pirellulales bacterium]|nr:S8 family serine peptidase [Pirellulales bacterium]
MGTRLPKRRRTLSLEPIESRLVMSAAPAYDFWLDAQALLEANSTDPAIVAPELQAARATSQSAGSAALTAIRDEYGFNGAGQTVAVIDTGIAWDTAALGAGFGAGYRIVGGWDFAENDSNPFDDGPAGGHGTHVAGIIGSSDTRYTGAAPGVDLVSLRVFDDRGGGTFAWVEQALRWVHEHRTSFANPITTVNISIGSTWNAASIPAWATLEDEFAQLATDGIFIAVAAGNSFTTYNTQGLSYPAASPYVVPVASTDADGQLSYFSQRSDRVLAAPGRLVTSTVPDYIGNRNGRNDDFAAMSGTSMAAPYVAGAAVLVREAYAFLGQTVNQNGIYNLLRNTADTVLDAATSATYRRLNIDRAIDTLMPANTNGTAAAATNLGFVVDTFSVGDMIARLGDRDYFRFTAARSGKLSITLDTASALRPNWALEGGSGTVDASGLVFTIDVIAGGTYTFDLGTSGTIGRYALTASLTAAMPDWGTINQAIIVDQAVGAGSDSFSFSAARDGIFTVEALAGAASAGVTFDLYDLSGRRLGTSAASASGQRLDVTVSAGQALVLRTHGASPDVDFRLTNLLTRRGSVLTAYGTAGDDTFAAAAGSQHQLSIDGVSYEFDATTLTDISFVGQGGRDRVSLTASGANNAATLRVGSVELVGIGYRFTATDVDAIEVRSLGAAGDRAVLYDGAGDDTLIAAPSSVQLTGTGFDNRATGFGKVQVVASGGVNEARLYDSAGNDLLELRPTSARLTGTGFDITATGFARVIASSSAGQDQASFYTAAAGDTFSAWSDRAELATSGYFRQALGFSRVVAFAGGQNNIAHLYGSAGNDTLSARPDTVELRGAGFDNSARGFALVRSYGGGGADEAYLYAGAGESLFVARPGVVQFSGNAFAYSARDFASVRAFAGQGTSLALLYHTPGDNQRLAQSAASQLSADGVDYALYGFSDVSAIPLAARTGVASSPVATSSFKTGDEAKSSATASSSSSAVSNLALLGKPAVAPKSSIENASSVAHKNAAAQQLARSRLAAIDQVLREAAAQAAPAFKSSFR